MPIWRELAVESSSRRELVMPNFIKEAAHPRLHTKAEATNESHWAQSES